MVSWASVTMPLQRCSMAVCFVLLSSTRSIPNPGPAAMNALSLGHDRALRHLAAGSLRIAHFRRQPALWQVGPPSVWVRASLRVWRSAAGVMSGPAYVRNARMDILAANDTAFAL
jgi:hypothetical protein